MVTFEFKIEKNSYKNRQIKVLRYSSSTEYEFIKTFGIDDEVTKAISFTINDVTPEAGIEYNYKAVCLY
jgi:hypothetical protein